MVLDSHLIIILDLKLNSSDYIVNIFIFQQLIKCYLIVVVINDLILYSEIIHYSFKNFVAFTITVAIIIIIFNKTIIIVINNLIKVVVVTIIIIR